MEENTRNNSKKKLPIIIVSCILVVSLIVVGIIVVGNQKKQSMYNNAVLLMGMGSYDESIELFAKLGDYSDSADKVLEVKFKKASDLMDDGSYDEAISIFSELGSYKESAENLEICKLAKDYTENTKKYNDALDYLKVGNLVNARRLFEELGDFEDSKEKIFRTLTKGDLYTYNEVEWMVVDINKDNPYYIKLKSKEPVSKITNYTKDDLTDEKLNANFLKNYPDTFKNSVLYSFSGSPWGHTKEYSFHYQVFLMNNYDKTTYQSEYHSVGSLDKCYIAMWIDTSLL